MAARLAEGFLDLLFPPRCGVCGAYGSPFCSGCRALIEPPPPVTAPAQLAGVVAAGAHGGPLREAVLRLKFGARLSLAEPLGTLLAETLAAHRDDWQPDVVVPVPIHWTRQLRRGFNQSDLLAACAAKRLAIPIARLVVRTRPTPPQVGQSAAQRAVNVRGAFAVHGRIPYRRVLLVDDVYTTGATLVACATTLRAAGAERVNAVTVTAEPRGTVGV